MNENSIEVKVVNTFKIKPFKRQSKIATKDGFNGFGKIRANQNIYYGSFNKFANKCGIYYIKNTKNNLIYIGSSKHIQNRLLKHISLLRLNKHPNCNLQKDYNDYGYNAFTFGVFEYVEHNDNKNLLDLEASYQKRYKPEELYNLSVKGEYNSSKQLDSWKHIDKSNHQTAEYRAKMRSIKINRIGRFDRYTEELLETFESSDEVCRKYKIAKSTLLGCCNGSKKTGIGFIWHYIDDKNNIMLQGKGRNRTIIQNEDIV